MRGRLADAWSALQAAFADRRMRRVQSAWSATVTAEWAIIVALGVWAFDAGGPVGVGVLAVARTVPAAVLGPLLTPLVDRHRRDRVLTTVTVLRFLLVAGMAVALLGHAAPMLVYVLAALDAVVYSLYWPAQSSLLTELARRPEELVAANVASTTIENIGGLAGPVIAALVLGVAGPGLTLATAGGLLAASALALLPLSQERPPARTDEGRDGNAHGDGRFAGFLHVATAQRPRVVAALYLSHTLAFGGLTVLLVVLALDRLGLGESGVGVLTAGMGAGGIAGSVMALGLVGHPRLARMLVAGVLAWAAAMGLLGLAPSVAVAVGLLAAAGLSNALVDVTALTLLQRLVPPPLLGRVLGVVEGAWWGAFGLGGLVASVLAAVLGVAVAFGLVGAVLAVLAVSVHARMDAIEGLPVPDHHADDLAAGHPGANPCPAAHRRQEDLVARPVVVRMGAGRHGPLVSAASELGWGDGFLVEPLDRPGVDELVLAFWVSGDLRVALADVDDLDPEMLRETRPGLAPWSRTAVGPSFDPHLAIISRSAMWRA